MIHEATFEDSMHGDAVSKRHSTVGEALAVAREAEARMTILTHFSQRYPTIPALSEGQQLGRVGIAFDGLQVGLRSTVNGLWALTGVVSKLFAKEQEDGALQEPPLP
ncbi:unnamed protein product [Chrysoparadoxa australica]